MKPKKTASKTVRMARSRRRGCPVRLEAKFMNVFLRMPPWKRGRELMDIEYVARCDVCGVNPPDKKPSNYITL